MTSLPATREPTPRRKLGAWLAQGMLAALGAVAGFLAVQGLRSESAEYHQSVMASDSLLVPLPDLVVTIGTADVHKTLRLSSSLEIGTIFKAETDNATSHIVDAAIRRLRDIPLNEAMARGASQKIALLLQQEATTLLGEGKLRKVLISQFIIH